MDDATFLRILLHYHSSGEQLPNVAATFLKLIRKSLGLGHRGAIRIIAVYWQWSAVSKVDFWAPSLLSFF